MRNIAAFCVAAGLVSAAGLAKAQSASVIYDQDGRRELIDQPVNPTLVTKARSVGALMARSSLMRTSNGYKVPATTFGDSYNLCPNERFRDQPNPAFCTAFLVDPQMAVTAASCISTPQDCAQIALVFDFAKSNAGVSLDVPDANYFTCAEIVSRAQGGEGNPDYTLIRLDRPVDGRAPLKFRRTGEIAVGTALAAVGHPSGLPTKIMDGAKVLTSVQTNAFFATDVDAFAGAAGSPIVATDGTVEGILARGGKDYEIVDGCTAMKTCAAGACAGQEATRASVISAFVEDPSRTTRILDHDFPAINKPIPDGNQAGITVDLMIDQPLVIAEVKVHVKITHTYIGDLTVSLIHPDGTAYVLHNQTGGSTDNLDMDYDMARTWRDKPSSGIWKIKVMDTAGQDTGTLDSVKINLKTFLN